MIGNYTVSLSYLGKIERGLYRPSAPLLKAIASALDVKVDDLISGKDAA